MQLTGVLSIGLLIAIAFLDLDVKGKVLNTGLIRKTRTLIYSWLAATVIYILIQIAYLLEQPFLASLDPTVIRSYLTQTSIGKSYLLQILGIGLLLLIPLKKVISTYVALLQLLRQFFKVMAAHLVIMRWQLAHLLFMWWPLVFGLVGYLG